MHPTYNENETPSFLQRHGLVLALGAVLLTLTALIIFALANQPAPKVAEREAPQTPFHPIPEPPQPPPPPVVKTPPVVEKKEEPLVEQTPVDKPVDKPVDPPKNEPIATPGTSGNGEGNPDAFGDGTGNGHGRGNLIGSGHGNGFGYWAFVWQQDVKKALHASTALRHAKGSVQVRLWPDATGKITRVELSNSSGNAVVDETLKNEVLRGLQLSEPPPQGMGLPVRMSISMN